MTTSKTHLLIKYCLWTTVLFLTNCEVHMGKYFDRSFEVRTERKAEVRIFSRMDTTDWSIRALLYSHNQRPKPKPSLNSVLNIFVSSLNAAVRKEFFSSSHISFKVKLSIKSKTCLRIFVILFVFIFLLQNAFDFQVQFAFLAVQYGFGWTPN